MLERFPDNEQRLAVLSALGMASYRRDLHQDAQHYGNQAEELARKMRKREELAFVLTYLGDAVRRLGEHRRSLTYSLEALGLYEKLADAGGVGEVASSVGYAYWRLGDYPKALSYFLRSQQAYAEIGDRVGVGTTMRNIGNLYGEIRRPREALALYQEALEVQEEEGDIDEIEALYVDMAYEYIALGDPDRALKSLFTVQDSLEKSDFRTGHAELYHLMGAAYRDLGEIDLAMDLFQRALQIRREIGDRKREAETLINIAAAETIQGRYEEALDLLLHARDLAVEVEAKAEILQAHWGLSKAYAGLRRFEEAFQSSQDVRRIEEQLFSEKSRRDFDDIYAHFNAEEEKRSGDQVQQQALHAVEERLRWMTQVALILGFVVFFLIVMAAVLKDRSKRHSKRKNAEQEERLQSALAQLKQSEARYKKQDAVLAETLARNELLASKGIESGEAELGLSFDDSSEEGRSSEEGTSSEEPLTFPEGHLPGKSAAMKGMYRAMRPLLEADLTVLIEGETGAGKEGVAQTLHLSSQRGDGPFVAVNCAAIPGELLEAEMFGIGKGVATGVSQRQGRFVAAEGGTLFLDEIGEMPLTLQAKLLRAVQEKKIQPVGADEISVDVWVIAATNRDLPQLIEEGAFRSDLYSRLAGFVLKVPPLRERRSDLVPLFKYFLRRSLGDSEKQIQGLTVGALRRLQRYPWPGNVRELEHEVTRLVHLTKDGQTIDSAMLSDRLLDPQPLVDLPPQPATYPQKEAGLKDPNLDGPGLEDLQPEDLQLKVHIQKLEGRLIREALEQSGGSQRKAAEILGISRNTLARKIADLKIRA